MISDFLKKFGWISPSRGNRRTTFAYYKGKKRYFKIIILCHWRKGDSSTDEYILKFSIIFDNLIAIGKPIDKLDKWFHLAHGLGPRYMDIHLPMLSKALYPSFTEFILALRKQEQVLLNHKMEKKQHSTKLSVGQQVKTWLVYAMWSWFSTSCSDCCIFLS